MILALLLACVPEPWEAVSVEDQGDVCLYVGKFDPWATTGDPAGTETSFTSTDDIVVHYVPLSCYSGSCTRNIVMGCGAAVDGTAITISGEGHWEVAAGNQDCTTDCGLGDTQCGISALAEGTYDVQFGTDSTALTIPSTATVCLHGE